MIHQENFWKTPDGNQLYTQTWLPEKETTAVILLVHGLGEHTGRYEHVARFFTDCGYALVGFDLRGHGKSEGVRGDVISFNQVCRDIEDMVQKVSLRFPGLPRFLYGHSMGGSLVLYYGLNSQPTVNGIVSTAPGLATAKPIPRSTIILGRVMARLAPTMQLDNGLDRSGLSRDEEVVRKYNTDPLVHPKISSRFGVDLIDKGKWIAGNNSFALPLLLIQGTADRIVDPNATRLFGQHLKGDVTLKFFEGFYHEVHNEPEQQEVLQYILEWMDAHR